MARVLVVELDATLCNKISHALRGEGLDVVTAGGRSGLREVFTTRFDVIVLGCVSPEITVCELLIQMRAQYIDTPVLLISTPGRERELVTGLDMGADRYLVKPISSLVLCAQVRALLRHDKLTNRGALATDQMLCVGQLVVNLTTRQVSLGGRSVDFSKRELALFRVLVEHSHAPLSRRELLRMVWGDTSAVTPNAVDVYIGYLRRRLRVLGVDKCIETCRGRGYQLNAVSRP